MRTYRDIFGLPEFRSLFLARSLTMAAISIGSLALGTTTYASTGSTVLTALAMFGGPLITLVGSATVLGASDAMGPRRATVVMPVAYVVAFTLQAEPGLAWWWRFAILAVPFLAGSATSGSTMRLLHEIVPADGFVLGRATLNIAVGVTQIAGFGLGGVLLVWFSPSQLFLIAAAGVAAATVILWLGIRERPGVAAGEGLVRRTKVVNRALLASPVIRPLYLAMWVPNGLIVGCEALFVPFGGKTGAGYLFAASASGMLLGDVLVGRFVPPRVRGRLIEPLRLLLAVPYLGFAFSPPLGVALALALTAGIGYSASLPLQERLVGLTPDTTRGQAFGVYSTGLMAGQAVGAAIGGIVAAGLGAAHAMGALAVVSVLVTVALRAGLKRSDPIGRPRAGERIRIAIPEEGIAVDELVLRLPTSDDLERVPVSCTEPDMLARAELAELVPQLDALVADGQLVPLLLVDMRTNDVLGGGTFRHFDADEAVVEIGYWLYPDARGRGAATGMARALAEHASGLGIRRVVAHVKAGNNASERVLERAGFTREGIARAMPTAGGRRVDKTVWSFPVS